MKLRKTGIFFFFNFVPDHSVFVILCVCVCLPSESILFIYFLIILFHLFLAALGLRCCAWAFSSCGERGLFFAAVRGLLIAVASRCGAWAPGVRASVVVTHGLSSCGSRALERRLSSCGPRA